jgi:uncharacterized membrane protein
MSRFLNKFTALLDDASEQELIDDTVKQRLRELAEDRERSRGVLSLAAVLGWLGGAILLVGIVLIVSANWDDIPSLVKLLGFFMLFAAAHAGGIYLRQRTELQALAEGLNFLGAGLFLGGMALISQIYQVEGRPPTMILIWFLAIAPLSWCFRSVTITCLSIAALLVWLHMEQYELGGNRFIFSFASTLMVEVGVGIALIGLAALLREPEPRIAAAFRGCGLLLLFYGVYMMGFYRHFSDALPTANWWPVLPAGIALLGGAAGLAAGYRAILPNNPYLRDRLVILLVLLLATAAAILLAEYGVIPAGPDLKFFNFGWYRTFHLTEWILSVAAWVLWFALAVWCVVFASRTGRRAYLNAGVLAVGLGVVTRFFDLIGGLFETGLAFVVGGGVLLVTCFAVEYWRRGILNQLKDADRKRLGAQP